MKKLFLLFACLIVCDWAWTQSRADNNGNAKLTLNSTAMPLRKGSGFYETIMGIYHYAELGTGKGWSLGLGGMIPFPMAQLKIRRVFTEKDKYNIGFSNSLIILPPFKNIFDVSRPQSEVRNNTAINFSIGSPQCFLNLNVGNTLFLTDSRKPLLNTFEPFVGLGGMCKLGKHWALLTDNILYLSHFKALKLFEVFWPTFSGRYYAQGFRIDAGLLGVVNDFDKSYPIPYLSFGLNFGRR